jgi:HNH endonuclease
MRQKTQCPGCAAKGEDQSGDNLGDATIQTKITRKSGAPRFKKQEHISDEDYRKLRFYEDIDAKVAIVPETGCWLWTGGWNNQGYGVLGSRNKKYLSHRVSYECRFGAIPDGLNVLHKCDTPTCCNPDHLFLGTHAENMRDCAIKGRAGPVRKPENLLRGARWALAHPESSVMGTSHPLHKLDEDKIRRIRVDTRKKRVIAEEYGVSSKLIVNIQQRRTWKHVV